VCMSASRSLDQYGAPMVPQSCSVTRAVRMLPSTCKTGDHPRDSCYGAHRLHGGTPYEQSRRGTCNVYRRVIIPNPYTCVLTFATEYKAHRAMIHTTPLSMVPDRMVPRRLPACMPSTSHDSVSVRRTAPEKIRDHPERGTTRPRAKTQKRPDTIRTAYKALRIHAWKVSIGARERASSVVMIRDSAHQQNCVETVEKKGLSPVMSGEERHEATTESCRSKQ
jgi:hypothetical protein